jgi:hypothetical protein
VGPEAAAAAVAIKLELETFVGALIGIIAGELDLLGHGEISYEVEVIVLVA